jgi:hypothetical protein
VLREERVDELRDDRVVVADDAREQRLAAAQLPNQVVADFLVNAPALDETGIDGAPQFAEGRDRTDIGHT